MAESTVGPWAADKLDRLRKYLSAYTTIMKGQRWCAGYHYIDAFAGPGVHRVRSKTQAKPQRASQALLDVASFGQSQEEQQQFLAGSPRVALDIEHPFSTYIFVERSPPRVAALQSLKAEYGNLRPILIRQRDCNKYLLEIVSNSQINWKTNRALVFLDPFGMQVPWKTLELLGRTKAIEVFLNFPVGMAIQRLLPRDTDKITDRRRAMLDGYFGSPEWFNVVYRKKTTLFGDEADEKIEQSGERLVKWYRDRLRDAFRFASKAALVRNTRGGHLYYLLLASPKQNGVKIADYILSAGETL